MKKFKNNDFSVDEMSYKERMVQMQIKAYYKAGLKNGKEEGIEIGMHEVYVKVAKNLLRDPKIDIDTVIDATSLERDEVLKLKDELDD
jgi:flagellar biosynthesis/type III secretory pathway protein FliH